MSLKKVSTTKIKDPGSEVGKENTPHFVTNKLKIMSLNVFSLLPHIDELKIMISEEKPHIIGINERKIDPTIDDSHVEIEDYIIVRKDRNLSGGGVALYIHKSLNFKICDELISPELEAIAAKIRVGNYKPFIITSLCRPPDKPVSYFDSIRSLINALDTKGLEFIVMGDANCNTMNKSDNDTKNLSKIVDSFNLKHLITDYTRVTASTKTCIDHILTNTESKVIRGVIPCGISDHDIVYMIKNMRIPKARNLPKVQTVRNYKKFDLNEFHADIKTIPFDVIRSQNVDDANKLWLTWKAFFLAILNKHAPLITIKTRANKLPYVNADLRRLIRQRDYLRGKANRTGSKLLSQAFNQMRSRVNHELHKARKDYYTSQIEKHKDSLKDTWKIIKHAIGQSNKATQIDKISCNGEVTTDKTKISEILNEYFVTIGERLARQVQCSDTEPTDNVPKADSKFVFNKITNVQVLKILTKLVNGKATGLHGIPNKAIKSSATLITPALTYIFNISIKTRVFTWDFKLSKVTPVFKSGDRDELGNYRPISVIPTIARVFEKLIYNQLHTYFMDNNLLSNEQYGFRSIHSTALALSRASNNWLIHIDNGSLNSVVFLDIQKAFDTVDHEIMLNKLMKQTTLTQAGAPGRVIGWTNFSH